MNDRDFPWEPPLAGSEAEHLIGALDRLRTTFRWKTDDLDVAGLRTRVGASSLTLGGLLKHLALVEDFTFTTRRSGEPIGARTPPAGTAATTGHSSPLHPTPPSGSTRCGTAPPNDPGYGWTPRRPMVDSNSSFICPGQTDAGPACAGSCVT